MSKFQIAILSLFGIFIVAGLLIFAIYRPNNNSAGPAVTIWGTVNENIVFSMISRIKETNKDVNVNYRKFREDTFAADLTEALATRSGPDAILVSQDLLYSNYNKILSIPYTNDFSEAVFKGTFIQETQSYLDAGGIIAVPFAVDPIVMYWNRDIFTNANLTLPPTTWEEFKNLAQVLTIKDSAGAISQSAVALGEFRNIDYAKDILSLLIIQAGNPIVSQSNGTLNVTLDSNIGINGVSASDAALSFYTQFANSTKQVYTWNRSLPNSKARFIANKLGIFFGYASDYNDIRQKNPNLNFDVALVPQVTASGNTRAVKTTFGKLYGLSMVLNTPDTVNTAKVLALFASKPINDVWVEKTGLPSVRFDSLVPDPSSAISAVFTTSALWSKGWIDPNRTLSNDVFQDMIENVTSNQQSIDQALQEAAEKLRSLY